MKKLSMLIFVFTFFCVITTSANAAPAPESIVVNNQQNSCGRFWAGDEFSQNSLTKGWTVVGYTFNIEQCASIPSGSDFIEQCCEKLGYKYVSDINAIKEDSTVQDGSAVSTENPRNVAIAFAILVTILIMTAALLVFKKRSKRVS
jgi:hypothetical protein